MTWEALLSAHGKHMVTDTCAIFRLPQTIRLKRAGEDDLLESYDVDV